jgi:uncharacterized protein
MSRIAFECARQVVESDPARNDIACFVGLARATGASLPPAIADWLRAHGWTTGPLARSATPPFTDLPLPIENYATFTALFDPGGSDASWGTDYLAAAVRSFFAQGGRRCYVVRMDDPVTPDDDLSVNGSTGRDRKLAALLPGDLCAPDDRRSWHAAGHLCGLPDVSFLAVPDLPILTASRETVAAGITETLPAGPALFIECGPPDKVLPGPPIFTFPAPRLTPDDYIKRWRPALQSILDYLSRTRNREITLLAALPLPQDVSAAAAAEQPSTEALTQDIHDAIAALLPGNIPLGATEPADPAGLSTAFLQLSYPWLKTSGSGVLNESLEPPDGALAGLLARNALTRGAFTDATKVAPSEVFDTFPYLPARETTVPSTPPVWNGSWKPLIMRVSLFGFTPRGMALLSDVTTYPGEAYRPARVHRLVSVISRAARQLGERVVFQTNGPALWRSVERSLGQLMTELWQLDALDGARIQDAFSVRCDSSTMTQNDIDNGRIITQVTFTAAATVELIRVTLALSTSGATADSAAILAGVG